MGVLLNINKKEKNRGSQQNGNDNGAPNLYRAIGQHRPRLRKLPAVLCIVIGGCIQPFRVYDITATVQLLSKAAVY